MKLLTAAALALITTTAIATEFPSWLEEDAFLPRGVELEQAIGIADDLRAAVLKAGLPCETLSEANFDARNAGDFRVACDGFVHAYRLSGDYGAWAVSRR